MKLTVLKMTVAAGFFTLATMSTANAQSLPGGNDLDLRSQAIDYCVGQVGVTIEMADLPVCIEQKYNELWRAKYGPHNGIGGPQGPAGTDPVTRCFGRIDCPGN